VLIITPMGTTVKSYESGLFIRIHPLKPFQCIYETERLCFSDLNDFWDVDDANAISYVISKTKKGQYRFKYLGELCISGVTSGVTGITGSFAHHLTEDLGLEPGQSFSMTLYIEDTFS